MPRPFVAKPVNQHLSALSPTIQRFASKASYFASSLIKRLTGSHNRCPSCGGVPEVILDRKAFVTCLVRCANCRLLFRVPTTSSSENQVFYQTAYSEGFTTERPEPERLHQWIDTSFSSTEKDYGHYLAILNALGVQPGARLFDYGCSWGYGSHQLARRGGYCVDAYEISAPRAAFAAEHLGVSVPDCASYEFGTYDVFFSAHVIEHVPSVSSFMEQGMRLLKPGGLFVAFTPNGSGVFRRHALRDWHLMWGLVHPQLIDEEFLLQQRPTGPLLIHSAPLLQFGAPEHLDGVRNWQQAPDRTPRCLDHVEMVFAFRV